MNKKDYRKLIEAAMAEWEGEVTKVPPSKPCKGESLTKATFGDTSRGGNWLATDKGERGNKK